MQKLPWAWAPIITLFISFMYAGCGDVGPQKRVGMATSIGSIMDAAKTLSGKEMEMAYTMCLSLRNKVTEFRSQHLGEIFSFEVDYTGCDKVKSATVVTTKLQESSGVLVYDSALPTFYFKNVETHTNGLLSPLCNNLLKGQTSSDTVDEGDGKRQFHFYAEDGKAKVMAYLAKRDLNAQSSTYGQYIIVREDLKTIETGPIVPGVILGLESDQTQKIPCPDGKTFESVRQTFLTHSTD